jgi:peptidoglycan/xylan/chitin deacetylase (PgdA/CDA1 family)
MRDPIATHTPGTATDIVHLTFDDGPDSEWTPRILDILSRAQVRATFFLIGSAAKHAPRLVRDIDDAGHAIGNHTFDHRHPWSMRSSAARQQVRDGASVIADITGRLPEFYRPPHGRNRPCMTEEARTMGASLVMWSRSAVDWGLLGNARGIHQRLTRTQPGEIVLMHDGRNRHNRPDQLALVLPSWLTDLQARGLQVRSLA